MYTQHQYTTLTVLSGHSGAGKTTRARQLFLDHAKPVVLITCDDHSFPAGADTSEYFIELAAWNAARGISVIIDGVNLHPLDRHRWEQVAGAFDEFEWVLLGTPLDECIRRDAVRPFPVGAEAICAQGRDWA